MFRRNKEEQEPSHNPAESQERLALPSVLSELPPEVGLCCAFSLTPTPRWALLPVRGWVVQSRGLVELGSVGVLFMVLPRCCGKEKMGASLSFSFPLLSEF